MRVGLVHWAMPPTTGGVESHVADLATNLARSGCFVTVLTGELNSDPVEGVEVEPLSLLNLTVLRESRLSTTELTARLTEVLGLAIEQRGLQIVHGHNLHHFFASPALALDHLRQKLGFRLHHTFHETWPDVLALCPVYRQWDGNYAVSRFVQNECARHIGFKPQVRPLGIDSKRFQTTRLCMSESQRVVILHPARLLPWKGVHISVEMLAQLCKRGIAARLIITDTQRIVDWDEDLESYRREILEKIHVNHIEHLIELRSIPYGSMNRLYDESDVVVYPTVGEEPYGLVPLEAMSMGRPVVASRSGGLTETIVDGVTGFLVERENPTALADCVARLVRDRELAQRIGQAGRRHVVENFDGQDYTSQLLEQYARSWNG